MTTVAALFVEADGPYSKVEGVDLWPESRDARLYGGPHPVVAHPPCARWSVLAPLVASKGGKKPGDDDGRFGTALASVRENGGVLEHPAHSAAWAFFGLRKPPSGGGWVVADWHGGWTCAVSQSQYGHVARKRTWLYAVGVDLPSLDWRYGDGIRVSFLGMPREGRTESGPNANVMQSGYRHITPPAFRDLLLSMARSVRR